MDTDLFLTFLAGILGSATGMALVRAILNERRNNETWLHAVCLVDDCTFTVNSNDVMTTHEIFTNHLKYSHPEVDVEALRTVADFNFRRHYGA